MRSERGPGALIPIRVRQFPKFLREIFVKRALIRRDVPRRSFRLCYFTCRSYYKYLYCSLHSLKVIGADIAVRVLIFCDANEMLSPAQVAAIEALHPGARVIPWGKSQGWGTEQIASIWKAYELSPRRTAPTTTTLRGSTPTCSCSRTGYSERWRRAGRTWSATGTTSASGTRRAASIFCAGARFARSAASSRRTRWTPC